MDYNLKVVKENNIDRYILSDSKDNFYTISKLLFEILLEYKKTNIYKEICYKMNSQRSENFLTEDFIEKSIQKTKVIIDNNKKPSVDKHKYIRNKFPIVKEGKSHKLFQLLSILFNTYIFKLLFSVSIIVTVFFFYKSGYVDLKFLYARVSNGISISNGIICYFLFILIILFHELGHASASYKYGIKPKEIGAGLYFIFPVLYTNVTNIWSLNVKNRIKVNLGGIYFQLIINMILITLLYLKVLNTLNAIFLILITTNTLSILVSFNPFFRYDGYWIFSDYFSIPNLREKSTNLMTTFILYPGKLRRLISAEKKAKAIIVYSIFNAAFWLWIYFSLIEYLFVNIPKMIFLVGSKELFTIKSMGLFLMLLLIFMWFFTSTINFFIKLLKFRHHVK